MVACLRLRIASKSFYRDEELRALKLNASCWLAGPDWLRQWENYLAGRTADILNTSQRSERRDALKSGWLLGLGSGTRSVGN